MTNPFRLPAALLLLAAAAACAGGPPAGPESIRLIDRFADGDVTQLIRTGDRVTVDPAAGLVMIRRD